MAAVKRSRRSTKPEGDDLLKLREKVQKRIRPASKLPKRYRSLFFGRSGSGKTRLASSAPNVLLIDVNEEGTDSVRNDYDPHVIQVKFWQEINDVFWYLQEGNHSYDTWAIDGLTGLQDLCMKFVLGDEAARDASRDPDMPSRAVYLKVSELMKTQITNYRNLPMNGIFTALERKLTTGEDDDESDVEIFYGPALMPSIASAAERAVGMIGYLQSRMVVVKSKRGGKSKRKPQTRLMIGPSERYLTKDRYGLQVPYIDSPNVAEIIDRIYGGAK